MYIAEGKKAPPAPTTQQLLDILGEKLGSTPNAPTTPWEKRLALSKLGFETGYKQELPELMAEVYNPHVNEMVDKLIAYGVQPFYIGVLRAAWMSNAKINYYSYLHAAYFRALAEAEARMEKGVKPFIIQREVFMVYMCMLAEPLKKILLRCQRGESKYILHN